MRKITLARGGALSPYSGLGSTHSSLVQRLKSGLVEGYELVDVHEYEIKKNPICRIWKMWFSSPSKVEKLSKESDIIHITDQEQSGLVPKSGKSVVTVHDLFHLYPSVRNGVKVGDQNPSFIRKSDLKLEHLY